MPGQRERVFQAIDKIVASPGLRTSESLCNLLRYLARQAIEHPDSAPKEYQIALDVFGRPPDFDSRLDSTVRVQTGRLRSKLVEYYAGPGNGDELVIGIPKGSYSLSIADRTLNATAAGSGPEPPATAAPPEQIATGAPGMTIGKRPLLILAAAAVLGAGAYGVWRSRAQSGDGRPSDATRAFWQVFFAKNQSPLVIFSNAEFVGAPTRSMGMRYFDPAADSPRDIRDHYTGIGEVFAVHELARLAARFGSEIHLKRGRLLAWDDAKAVNLIFLGSTVENLSLRELRGQSDFVFRLKEGLQAEGRWEIVNLKPEPGEKATYPGANGLPPTEDHAVIALLPAPAANRWVLILAGTTTLGTQAAAEFVCRPATLQKLTSRLNSAGPAPVPFEAVIRAEISGSVPVRTEIVAVHVGRKPA